MPRGALPFVVLFLAAASAVAQVPAGPEFLINTYTTGNQPGDSHGIASGAAGDFVVVWDSAQGGSTLAENDVFGQRYDASGAPQGAEFRVNAYTTDAQWLPAVAADANGNFVVVWNDNGQDGSGSGVFGQRFDRNGTRRGGEFRANAYTTGEQFRPWVASDPAGNFLVAWEYDDAGSPTRHDVFGRLYDREGVPRGPDFLVNTYTTDFQFNEAAAFDETGNFVVVWTSGAIGVGQDGSYTGIFGQRFSAAGAQLGAEFQVNSYTTGYQRYGSVASAADGRFVVAWTSKGQDGSGYGIFAQRFDRSGVAQGGEFRVNAYTTGDQWEPRVASDPSGNFVVAWNQDDGSGFWWDVVARRYDAAGSPRGGEFRVNTWTTYSQASPQLAADAAGNFVVTWQSFPGQDGSGTGLFGQRFGGIEPQPTTVDGTGNGVFEPGETVGVATAWRNVSGIPRAFTGVASAFTGPGAPNNPTYTIIDGAADYGVVPSGAVGSCTSTANCYALSIGPVTVAPAVRPVLHWDATFREDIFPESLGQSLTRRLHVGDSFTDVVRASPYYRFVETILHHGITGGCGGGNFCPVSSTPREQMAVFVLVAKEGSYQPPACVPGTEMFSDVPASSPFCRWIEELAHRGIAGGCGGGNFCPLSAVSREQMTVFALATKEAAGYSPPPCVAGSEMFADVPASSPFCRWIEELGRRGIIGGCGGGNFCPLFEVSREQNAVFLTGTFGLLLY